MNPAFYCKILKKYFNKVTSRYQSGKLPFRFEELGVNLL